MKKLSEVKEGLASELSSELDIKEKFNAMEREVEAQNQEKLQQNEAEEARIKQEYEDMKNLIFRSGKLTYYMLMLLCFPVIFECNYILHLWLGSQVPESTVVLTRLVLIISMTETFTYSIGCAV